jgi:isopenicillin N synthase-like dioxygenase
VQSLCVLYVTDVCIDNLTVEYADLGIIDFSKVDTEEGRAELADQVKKGLRNHGFLYIVNHGYTQEEVKHFFHIICTNHYISTQTNHMFDLADVPFSCIPEDEKPKYSTQMFETGLEVGFKLRKYWVGGSCLTYDHLKQVKQI